MFLIYFCFELFLGNQVSRAQRVRNLGEVFKSNFNLSDLVSQVIKSTRVHVRELYRICPLLDLNTSVLLVNALLSSRLDYCNSLFLLLTDFETRRLQLVQNSFCRVVTCSSKFSHITPQLKTQLNTLQIFGNFLGLRMNQEKTKIIWIGRIYFSKFKLNVSQKLDWGCTNFTFLGLHFSVSLDDV